VSHPEVSFGNPYKSSLTGDINMWGILLDFAACSCLPASIHAKHYSSPTFF